jgi:hypothetical protein
MCVYEDAICAETDNYNNVGFMNTYVSLGDLMFGSWKLLICRCS